MSKFCEKCGAEVDSTARFCPFCGHQLLLEYHDRNNTANNISKAEYFEKYASADVEKRSKQLKMISKGIIVFQIVCLALTVIGIIIGITSAFLFLQGNGVSIKPSGIVSGVVGGVIGLGFNVALTVGSILLLRSGVKRRDVGFIIGALIVGVLQCGTAGNTLFGVPFNYIFMILSLIAYIIVIIFIHKDNQECSSFLKL